MSRIRRFRVSVVRRSQLLSFVLFLAGCNDVLGFQEGKPYPPDAGGNDVDAAPVTEAGSDVDAGRSPGPDAGCSEGFRRCANECIPSSKCCNANDCPTGGADKEGTCTCPAETHECSNA